MFCVTFTLKVKVKEYFLFVNASLKPLDVATSIFACAYVK